MLPFFKVLVTPNLRLLRLVLPSLVDDVVTVFYGRLTTCPTCCLHILCAQLFIRVLTIPIPIYELEPTSTDC